MSDEKPPQPIMPNMPKRIAYVVTYDLEKGEVQVSGPIQQKIIAVKAMTHAINIIMDYVPPVIENPKNGASLLRAN